MIREWKVNFHTHHELCGHAKGKAKDYIIKAIEQGFNVLGFSDHAPSTVLENAEVRMHFTELDSYIFDINESIAQFGDKIQIYKGLETEYFNTVGDINTYYDKLREKVDYLILGQHYVPCKRAQNNLRSSFHIKTKKSLKSYEKHVVKGIKTGYFNIVAHPDIYMSSYPSFDRQAKKTAKKIIKAAIKQDIPLEMNAKGIRKGKIQTIDGEHYRYPRKEFFTLAKQMGARIIAGSDSHEPNNLDDYAFQEIHRLATQLNITLDKDIKLNN